MKQAKVNNQLKKQMLAEIALMRRMGEANLGERARMEGTREITWDQPPTDEHLLVLKGRGVQVAKW